MTYKLHQFSDIHFEFMYHHEVFFDKIDSKGIDGVILAGDIVTMRDLEPLRAFCDVYPLVIHVPGNHEYYGSYVEDVEKNLRELAEEKKNYVPLFRDTYDFHGHKIHGSTLWFRDQPDNFFHQMYLNDFRAIKGFTPWVYEEHEKTIVWLDKVVKPGDIVVSHHLPADHCIDKEYIGDPLNRFYSAGLDNFVDRLKPSMWIHGHSHRHLDKVVGDTRFIRNPHGYHGIEQIADFVNSTGFEKNFVIELEDK